MASISSRDGNLVDDVLAVEQYGRVISWWIVKDHVELNLLKE